MAMGAAGVAFIHLVNFISNRRQSSPRLSTVMKASCGTFTLPIAFIRFFPFACLLSSFFFREMSPP